MSPFSSISSRWSVPDWELQSFSTILRALLASGVVSRVVDMMGFAECCQVQRVRLWANKLLVEAGEARSLLRDVWKG